MPTFWLHLTFEISLTLWTITFDIKAHLSRNARSSGDDDNTRVAAGVGFLGVVDVDGEVCRGHGHTEAHSFCELVLAVPDLTWAEVYHLRQRETRTTRHDRHHRIIGPAGHRRKHTHVRQKWVDSLFKWNILNYILCLDLQITTSFIKIIPACTDGGCWILAWFCVWDNLTGIGNCLDYINHAQTRGSCRRSVCNIKEVQHNVGLKCH